MEKEIVQFIKEMPEEEVKKKFARLMLNYNKINSGKFPGNYSKEDCMNDYEEMYREIVLEDMFKL